ncbi:MAG: hypothetical protein H7X97_14025 [Opitutaceae bacterium]|nr:hypothetical protein [Verrucomicrobiales bacterium]
MKPSKPQSLPKKLRDEIAALMAQIQESAKMLAAARDGFLKAKAAVKRAKTAARNTRKAVKSTKKRLASLRETLSQVEKKAAKWTRKHSHKDKPGRRKASRNGAVVTKKTAPKRAVQRRKSGSASRSVPMVSTAVVLAPLAAESVG